MKLNTIIQIAYVYYIGTFSICFFSYKVYTNVWPCARQNYILVLHTYSNCVLRTVARFIYLFVLSALPFENAVNVKGRTMKQKRPGIQRIPTDGMVAQWPWPVKIPLPEYRTDGSRAAEFSDIPGLLLKCWNTIWHPWSRRLLCALVRLPFFALHFGHVHSATKLPEDRAKFPGKIQLTRDIKAF